jgi:hypothetical protein
LIGISRAGIEDSGVGSRMEKGIRRLEVVGEATGSVKRQSVAGDGRWAMRGTDGMRVGRRKLGRGTGEEEDAEA